MNEQVSQPLPFYQCFPASLVTANPTFDWIADKTTNQKSLTLGLLKLNCSLHDYNLSAKTTHVNGSFFFCAQNASLYTQQKYNVITTSTTICNQLGLKATKKTKLMLKEIFVVLCSRQDGRNVPTDKNYVPKNHFMNLWCRPDVEC